MRLNPDAEKLVAAYLRGKAAVAAVVGARVYTRLPDDPVFPFVVLTRIGGERKVHEHLDQPVLQVDVWAAERDQTTAQAALRPVRGAFNQEEIVGSYADGVVSGTEEIRGPGRLPDPATSRERWSFDVQVFIRNLA